MINFERQGIAAWGAGDLQLGLPVGKSGWPTL